MPSQSNPAGEVEDDRDAQVPRAVATPVSPPGPPPPPASWGWEFSRVWAVAPGVLAALPALIFAASPAFYIRHVVSEQYREYQAAEMITFGSAVLGGVLLGVAAVRLWRRRPGAAFGPGGARGLPDRHLAWFLPAVAGIAALFFGGEEVNWGQTFANWGVAENQQKLEQVLNLHNTTEWVSIQSLGSVFVIGLFLVVPLVWLGRRALNLPAIWRPAIPPLAAVVSVGLGLAIAESKDVYAAAYGTDPGDRLYWDFIEQWNELKEMLIAFAFLLYGLAAMGRAGMVRKMKTDPALG